MQYHIFIPFCQKELFFHTAMCVLVDFKSLSIMLPANSDFKAMTLHLPHNKNGSILIAAEAFKSKVQGV